MKKPNKKWIVFLILIMTVNTSIFCQEQDTVLQVSIKAIREANKKFVELDGCKAENAILKNQNEVKDKIIQNYQSIESKYINLDTNNERVDSLVNSQVYRLIDENEKLRVKSKTTGILSIVFGSSTVVLLIVLLL